MHHRLAAEPLEDRLAPASAGDLDPTFAGGGIATVAGTVQTERVVALPNGDVAATARLADQSYVVVAYLPDGTPDAGFGSGGRVAFPGEALTALAAQPDGKLLVLGTTAAGQVVVSRLTAAGQPDATFGTNGTATAPLDADPNTPDHPAALAVAADGAVVVAGGIGAAPPDVATLGFGTDHPFAAGDTSAMAATRLSSAGVVDPGFGTNGFAVVPFPIGAFNAAAAGGVAVGPDGRVVLAGEAAAAANGSALVNDLVVVRLTAAGGLDPAFGAGGRVRLPRDPAADRVNVLQDAAVRPDGSVLVAGIVSARDGARSRWGTAAKFRPDGSLDPAYGSGGIGYANATSTRGTIGPDGRAVFAGYGVGNIPASGYAVARVTDYGAYDTRFPAYSDFFAFQAVELADGRVVVAGARGPFSSPTGVLVRLLGNGPPPGFVPAAAGDVVVGGPADGTFQVFSRAGGSYAPAGTITAFPNVSGLPGGAVVRTTTADVVGDATPDYVVGAGPGGGPQVTVFDGATGNIAADLYAFESTFTGGVFVAAADLDGDGSAELVVTPDQGGGGRVVIVSVVNGVVTPRASFFGIDDPAFRGGARVALGDVDHDGHPDLVVAAGFGGGPRVAVFDGKTVLAGTPARLVGDFFAFPGTDAADLRNGAYVAAGDVDGDGHADLIFGGGPGGAPRVFILSGALVAAGDITAAYAAPVANFFVAGNSTDRGGVRVAAVDADGDAKADVASGSGAGDPARVRVYLGKNFTGTAEPAAFQDLAPFGGAVLADGVYVG